MVGIVRILRFICGMLLVLISTGVGATSQISEQDRQSWRRQIYGEVELLAGRAIRFAEQDEYEKAIPLIKQSLND